jgi:hypothetical protein
VVVDPSVFSRLYVLGVLSPSVPHQEVYIATSQSEGKPRPVEDAQVWIRGPAGEVELTHVGEGVYRDVAGKLNVEPGKTFNLRARLADGRGITAKTTVPAGFTVLEPTQGDTVLAVPAPESPTLALFTIRWSTDQAGWVTQTAVFHSTGEYIRDCYSVTDSVRFPFRIPWSANDPLIFPVTIYFANYDTAFSIQTLLRRGPCPDDFRRFGLSPATEDLLLQVRSTYRDERINVEGAYGVFGSVVRDSVRVYIRLESGV